MRAGVESGVLERLHLLALRLFPWRGFIIGAGACFLVVVLYALLGPVEHTRQALQPGVIGALWSGLLYAFLEMFQHIPPRPSPEDRWLRRLSLKFRRACYTLLSALVVLTTLLLVSISLRLILV